MRLQCCQGLILVLYLTYAANVQFETARIKLLLSEDQRPHSLDALEKIPPGLVWPAGLSPSKNRREILETAGFSADAPSQQNGGVANLQVYMTSRFWVGLRNEEALPVMIVRYFGHGAGVCTTSTRLSDQTVGSVEIKVTCHVPASGVYYISAMMLYEHRYQAVLGPPRCMDPCVCSELLTENNQRLSITVSKESSTTPTGMLPPYWFWQLSAPWADAQNILSIGSNSPEEFLVLYRNFTVLGESSNIITLSFEEPQKLEGIVRGLNNTARIYIAGDSHQRYAYESLLRLGLVDVSYIHFSGLVDHHIHTQDHVSQNKTCGYFLDNLARTGMLEGKKDDGLIERLDMIRSAVCNSTSVGETQQESKHGVVIFETGHWDLRDLPVKMVVESLENVMQKIAELDWCGAKIMWRSAPAYSYKRFRKPFILYEFRSLENLRLLAGKVRELSAKHDFMFWDTYAVTVPFFENTCDDTHYLCRWNALTSQVGTADLVGLIASIQNSLGI